MRATLLDTRLLLLLLLLLKALSTRAAACPVLLPEPASTAETANTASAAAMVSSTRHPSGLLVTGNILRHDTANAKSCPCLLLLLQLLLQLLHTSAALAWQILQLAAPLW
jgi:hypothetical protein